MLSEDKARILNVPVSRAEYVVGIKTYFPAGRSLKLIDMVPVFEREVRVQFS